MADVVDDGKQRADGVHAQREPPDELFVEFLFEILEHQQADGEAGQGAGYVGHVADGWRGGGRLESVPAVNGEADVHASCESNDKKNKKIVFKKYSLIIVIIITTTTYTT